MLIHSGAFRLWIRSTLILCLEEKFLTLIGSKRALLGSGIRFARNPPTFPTKHPLCSNAAHASHSVNSLNVQVSFYPPTTPPNAVHLWLNMPVN